MWVDAEFLARQCVQRLAGLASDALGELACSLGVDAFGLIDQRQFFALLLRRRLHFLALDRKLVSIQLACALHRERRGTA